VDNSTYVYCRSESERSAAEQFVVLPVSRLMPGVLISPGAPTLLKSNLTVAAPSVAQLDERPQPLPTPSPYTHPLPACPTPFSTAAAVRETCCGAEWQQQRHSGSCCRSALLLPVIRRSSAPARNPLTHWIACQAAAAGWLAQKQASGPEGLGRQQLAPQLLRPMPCWPGQAW
jgi:hypothetical protein